jgi:predicted nucleotidyltransferase component of viral defense system
LNSRDVVEQFHLVFLRHFAPTVSPGTICLKGGVNLRLYHQSPRLSEDMDFDARVVGVEILKKNVNKVLAGRPLRTELSAAGIALGEINPAKQTPTVQRWKLHVIHEDQSIPTRLEFSRRGDEEFEGCCVEKPSASLLAERRLVPFVFNRYDAGKAYRQKVQALAARTVAQARDVFDLHHLAPFAASAKDVPREILQRAMEQLELITFDMFMGQVVPFLPSDLASHDGTRGSWDAMLQKVRADLVAAARARQP